jgi:ribonuclease Z
MLRVTFLGTAASRPTVGRNVSSLAVQREGELMLFDCGEGTQRQMMRFGTGFNVGDIFLTHVHADHFLGVTGLLRTLALQDRAEPIRLWAPEGSAAIVWDAINLGRERVPFQVTVAELEPEQVIARTDFDIVAFPVRHGGRALGYALIERPRLGRFNPGRARELGVPEGPLFGRLHKGEAVEVDGRLITPDQVVGTPRPGRRLVYSGDTRPARSTVAIAKGADLLIHDATFAEDEAERARLTGHSTAREAGELARAAGVTRLALTHVSARYADDPRPLEREARAAFRGAVVAWDGMEIEIPLQPGEDGEPPA